jgi:hypothetical protein
MANDGHQIAVAARLRPEHAEAFSPLWKVTRSTRPASTSWVDDSGPDFMWALGSPVLSSHHALGAAQVVYRPIWAALAEWRLSTMPSRPSGRGPDLRRTGLTVLEFVLHQYDRIGSHEGVKQRECRSHLSLLSSTSRSHIEESDLLASGKSCAVRVSSP